MSLYEHLWTQLCCGIYFCFVSLIDTDHTMYHLQYKNCNNATILNIFSPPSTFDWYEFLPFLHFIVFMIPPCWYYGTCPNVYYTTVFFFFFKVILSYFWYFPFPFLTFPKIFQHRFLTFWQCPTSNPQDPVQQCILGPAQNIRLEHIKVKYFSKTIFWSAGENLKFSSVLER